MRPHALFLAPLLFLSGCLGPFNATRTVLNWNATLHEEDAVCEVVFIALTIIPVYPLVGLADALVLNTVDYWSGENPLEDPGPFPSEEFQGGGASKVEEPDQGSPSSSEDPSSGT